MYEFIIKVYYFYIELFGRIMPKHKLEECSGNETKGASPEDSCVESLPSSSDMERDDTSNSSIKSELSSEVPSTTVNTTAEEASDCDEPPKKKPKKKSVCFANVTVYYFPRTQGFTCVPSQGGSTLGKHYLFFYKIK